MKILLASLLASLATYGVMHGVNPPVNSTPEGKVWEDGSYRVHMTILGPNGPSVITAEGCLPNTLCALPDKEN